MASIPKIVFHDTFRRKYKEFTKNNDKTKKKIDSDLKELIENRNTCTLTYDNTFDFKKSFGFFEKNSDLRIIFHVKNNVLVLLDLVFSDQIEKMEICDFCSSVLEEY
jgi:mRNA-degrading endonuclease RelE of RelBE toxin-antitoxin system